MQDNILKPMLKNSPTIPATTDQVEPPPRMLLDRVRDAIRFKHYSYQTEKSYVQRIRRFILFHHSNEMGGAEVNAFTENVAASTSKSGVLIASDRIFLAFNIVL